MMMSGVFVIDKHEGATSREMCSFVSRLTGVKKVGHGGTLDPLATGVLPVFVGNATRVIEYMSEKDDLRAKKYRATMRLGITTDTQDTQGSIIGEAPTGYKLPSRTAVEATLKSFLGEGEQMPPAYSAVKYKGKRLYDYARRGEAPPEGAIKRRRIFVSEIELLRYDAADVEFELVCSGGLYVRTICNDVGDMLGCGGAMSALRRLKSGPYIIEDSVTVEELERAAGEGADALPLLPVDSAVAALAKVALSPDMIRRFVHGQSIGESADLNDAATQSDKAKDEGGLVAVYEGNMDSDAFVGVGLLKNGVLTPRKVLL
jgi:tRNA pseudouridine55 synthase